MNTQILDDAKEAGFKIHHDGLLTHCGYYVDDLLTKFAELTKARTLAELDALKQPIDELAEFKKWYQAVRGDSYLGVYAIAYDAWQARAQIPTNSNDAINSKRWTHYANSSQTAYMLGTKLDYEDQSIDWLTECNLLVDAEMKEGK